MSILPGDICEIEDLYDDDEDYFIQQVEEYNKEVIDDYLRKTPKPVSSISPRQLMQSFSDYLTNNPRTYQRALNVKGIYRPGKGTAYNGYFYDFIKEETSDFFLKVYIPLQLRANLQANNLVVVKGFIYKDISNTSSSIELVLTITEIVSKIKDTAISEEDEKRLSILQQKTSKGFAPVESILRAKLMKGEKPKIYFQFPPQNDVSADVTACIKSAPASIDIISNNSVPFTRTDLLCQQLRYADMKGYDAICLIRGGGAGIEALDNSTLMKCLCDMRTPTIGAIGHAPDKKRHFVMGVFDLNKETPSALGQFLNDLVQSVTAERNNSLAILTKQIEDRYRSQLKQLADDKAKLQKEAETTKESIKTLTTQKDNALKEQIALTTKIGELKHNLMSNIDNAVKEQISPLKHRLSIFKIATIVLAIACFVMMVYIIVSQSINY